MTNELVFILIDVRMYFTEVLIYPGANNSCMDFKHGVLFGMFSNWSFFCRVAGASVCRDFRSRVSAFQKAGRSAHIYFIIKSIEDTSHKTRSNKTPTQTEKLRYAMIGEAVKMSLIDLKKGSKTKKLLNLGENCLNACLRKVETGHFVSCVIHSLTRNKAIKNRVPPIHRRQTGGSALNPNAFFF